MEANKLYILDKNNYEQSIDIIKNCQAKTIELQLDIFNKKTQTYNLKLYDILEFYLSIVPEILYYAHIQNINLIINPYFKSLKKFSLIEQYYIIVLNQVNIRLLINKLYHKGNLKDGEL